MASCFRSSEENDFSYTSQKILQVTILASEWGSSKGGLSTINRELAIELAKWPEVQITLFMPQCSEEDKQAALDHKIRIVKAERRPGYDELEWLSFPPDHLKVDVIVGHGVKLGRQAQVIRKLHNCKWVQVVHTDPEELGMFKSYQNPISTGEKKHKAEVELCEMADFVVGVGPKLSEAFRSYLRWCKKDQTILDITPGVFHEFVNIEHAANEREWCSVLVFGRGDAEDFQLKGFDIAGSAVAELDNARLIFVGAPEGKHEEIKERFEKCGVPKSRLKIRSFLDCRESLRKLFYEVDLTLMPSRTEGFGLTGLEALSAGVPVLVSSNSGFGKALSQTPYRSPFGSSFVINSEDPKVWAAEMKNIWTKDRQQRLQEAKVLRTCYESKYSWSNQCKFLVDKMVRMCHDASGTASSHSAVSATLQATQTMDLTSEKLHTEHCGYEGQANVISGTFHSKVPVEISCFESDITFFAKRHDPDTRQWFFDDFNAWFRDPGDSRAYVLLGDPGVGKSVIAGALAKRMRDTRQLGAAYFCRHNDGTRNDPRNLLGTVAHQLCACNDKYKEIVGGEDGVKMLLDNSKLGVRELFTKLLHEPLSICRPRHQKVLVIIDALDETQYDSREAFLDLIKHRFPLLPEWLVFFITSRPEDSVQSRLKRYNPCINICAGNSNHEQNFYQQHEQDIQNFLKKRIDFSCVSISVDDVSQKCDGLFLYAYYIVEELKDALDSAKKISNLNDLFPGDIEEFFLQNVRRVYDHVGENVFKKLFGCAIVAPSPLPVSVISFILNKENSNHDEQQVIDAVSQFLVLRTPDQTLTFLHNLVPAWLTNDTKAPRELFICKKIAGGYLREVVVEILSSIGQESPSPCTSIDVKLEDYVMRVAVRFLCHFGGKDWLELVFTCLTNYHLLERRLLSGKTEIYHLLHDLKLISGCLDVDDKKKQDLLQEITRVLSVNAFVLSECPQLLHSCLRTASNAVQETFLLYKLPVPCLECTVFAFPDPAIADMHCFATSSDKITIVGAKNRRLLFFDTYSAQRENGPFEISEKIIHTISHLEYSRDNEFIFLGRLDKWFSVERKCVEDFLQFKWNATVYQLGFLTRDGESIVVKRNMENLSCNRSGNTCLCNLLALWAVKEIEESRDVVMSLHKELVGVGPIKCLLNCLSLKTNLAEPEVKSTYIPSVCRFCYRLSSLTDKGYQEASLTAIRQKIIEIYPFIFRWQVWDLKTGRPGLERAFVRDVQLEPFTYICHVSYFVNRWAMEIACSNFSICNIAIITAIRYLEDGLSLKLRWEPPEELKPAKIPHLTAERTVKVEELLENLLERDMVLGLTEELKRRVNHNLESELKRLKKEEEEDSGELENEPQRLLQRRQELKLNVNRDKRRRDTGNYLKQRDLEQKRKQKLEDELEKQVQMLERKLEAEIELEHNTMGEIVSQLELKWVLKLDVVYTRECMAQLEDKLSLEVKDLEPKLREELKLLEGKCEVEHELVGRKRGLEIDQQELKLKQGLKLPVKRVHELQNKLACLEELKRMLERRRRQEPDPGELNLIQKLKFLLERERGSRHEIDVMEFRDYQVLKFVLEQERRWEKEMEESEKGQFIFPIKCEREFENEIGDKPTKEEKLKGWLADIRMRWNCHERGRELTSTELDWVRLRFHKLQQLEVIQTAEEELQSLLQKIPQLTSGISTPLFSVSEQSEMEKFRSAMSELDEAKKRFETLKGRKRKLTHDVEIKLNKERDHEVKDAQCWTAWVENELVLKGRENLMKKYRWLRVNLLTRKLSDQLEKELYRGVWESYLRALKEENMKMDPYLVKEFQHGSIKCENYANFLEAIHDVETIVNEDVLICHSPGGKWVLEADGFRNKHVLRKSNRELSCDHATPQRDIGNVARFSFTKDDSYLVYLTDNGLLHALSLETGTVLTSISNNNIIYFTGQYECGYLFRSDTEERAILFSNLFSPFKFIPASPVELPVVEKAIAAAFCSANTVLAVGSDLMVSFWKTAEVKDGLSFICKSLLDTSDSQVKNCALSPDGRHIAIHHRNKLMLYTFTDFRRKKTCKVFTEEFGYTISSFTFSGDSASLLFCIQDSQSFTRGDVWDIVGQFISGSVKSQKLVVVECCCLSSGKQEVILCGKYLIEIWKYGESSCHLSTTLHVEEMYHSLRFSQCIVSSDNQLLICCIANMILVYRRNVSDVNFSKRVLQGHLGKIEFCRFLKENRYLISYGIDGMVFFWDTIECKAIGFKKIPLDTVVCMALSPDEEKIVCYSSTNLICIVKLCELKSPSQ
ncbi:uncharacterized protein LOC111340175 [Stylophora pistillata]|nr:uncharacterized protein LOC111340175 [Stylophora pistillata]